MATNSIFVDTSGWACYLNAFDPFHKIAAATYQQAHLHGAAIYTTDHVLAELVALLSSTHFRLSRQRVVTIVSTILDDHGVTVEPTGWPQFLDAWRLLERRLDKMWSLVDAISFGVMERFTILDALTTDEHFEQAGKVRLLK
jgi:predicted nucleic acid-binding protein